MRVCWLASSYPRWEGDGAGIYLLSLARTLVQLGHQVDVIVPWDPKVQPMDTMGVGIIRFKYAPVAGAHILGHGRSLRADVTLKLLAPLLIPGFASAMAQRAFMMHRRAPYDLIHAHWCVPSGYIASIIAGCLRLPYMVTLHGSDVYVTGNSKLYALAARRVYRRAQHVTAVSQHLLERSYPYGLERNKAVVIPCGVDVDRFNHGDGLRMRSALGINPEAPVVGAIGRLVYKKGFKYLVGAMAQVRQRYPNCKCIIAGEGDLKTELTRQIQASGLADTVSLVGHVSWTTTPDFYAMCDVVVVPSVIDTHGNVDGLPNVLLEAMAARTAVVASDLPGIQNLVSDGVTGRLVTPNSEDAIAAAVNDLLANQPVRRLLGEAARTLMETQYTWRFIAERFIGLYQEMTLLHQSKH